MKPQKVLPYLFAASAVLSGVTSAQAQQTPEGLYKQYMTPESKAQILDLMSDVKKPAITAAMPVATPPSQSDIDLNDPKFSGRVSIEQIEQQEKQHPGSHVRFDFNGQKMAISNNFIMKMNETYKDYSNKLVPGIRTSMHLKLSNENNMHNPTEVTGNQVFSALEVNTAELALMSEEGVLDDLAHEAGHAAVKVSMVKAGISDPDLRLPKHGNTDIVRASRVEREKAALIEFAADRYAMLLISPKKVMQSTLALATPNPTKSTMDVMQDYFSAFDLDEDHPGAGLRYVQAVTFDKNKDLLSADSVMSLPAPELKNSPAKLNK